MVRALAADVLCVQERGLGLAFSRLTGLEPACHSRFSGVAVLVRPGVRVVHAEHRRLRWFPGLERRSMAVAVVEAEGLRLAAVSFHLDLHAGARLAHAVEIVRRTESVAARFDAVPVLAGDLNELPEAAAWRHLASRYDEGGDGATFAGKRIDAIFTGRGVAALARGVAGADEADLTVASDHRPVVTDLRLA
ncbi:endonuclease/exonuclease/phosphatase family protein [Herbidospora solisilvae]|uniref:endonuclease/exonuclease/phosphatase family protein n=1 Tax=Herbidospora solisilvae TaxID=2696284 RepID=UPI002E2B4CFD|nr:endonuclease/exonuclease/phosphatase family protein [Herbidospora solisilvae]